MEIILKIGPYVSWLFFILFLSMPRMESSDFCSYLVLFNNKWLYSQSKACRQMVNKGSIFDFSNAFVLCETNIDFQTDFVLSFAGYIQPIYKQMKKHICWYLLRNSIDTIVILVDILWQHTNMHSQYPHTHTHHFWNH